MNEWMKLTSEQPKSTWSQSPWFDHQYVAIFWILKMDLVLGEACCRVHMDNIWSLPSGCFKLSCNIKLICSWDNNVTECCVEVVVFEGIRMQKRVVSEDPDSSQRFSRDEWLVGGLPGGCNLELGRGRLSGPWIRLSISEFIQDRCVFGNMYFRSSKTGDICKRRFGKTPLTHYIEVHFHKETRPARQEEERKELMLYASDLWWGAVREMDLEHSECQIIIGSLTLRVPFCGIHLEFYAFFKYKLPTVGTPRKRPPLWGKL